jgi:hypothetical protein
MTSQLISLVFISIHLTTALPNSNWRSLDGSSNNAMNPSWGSAGIPLQRMGNAVYDDGISSPRKSVVGNADLTSPRVISNNLFGIPPPNAQQPKNKRGLTDFVTYWGQFIAHDLGLSGGPKGNANPLEPIPIHVPSGDPSFDRNGTGTVDIPLFRSVYANSTGPRQQINLVSAYLDGSQVYGSDDVMTNLLRNYTGGLLKTMMGPNNLPISVLNSGDLSNENNAHVVNNTDLFLFGDVRGNENAALSSLHILFVREHNRRATQLASVYPTWGDEQLFQEARRWVIALIEQITFNEYLPVTIGDSAPEYTGYNSSIDVSIVTEFSTGAFRYGHSEVNEWIRRLDSEGKTLSMGNLHLRDAYYDSPNNIGVHGIEPILRGLSTQIQNSVDTYFIDDLRNYLFGHPGSGGMDLAAINTQRGRDHGLPGFNKFREAYGLAPKNWSEITSDEAVRAALMNLYASVDDCDVYVCGLAEEHLDDTANVGETFFTSIIEQYVRTRAGDRFWFQNEQWSAEDMTEIEVTTLSDVIVRNTPIQRSELQCFLMADADGCGKSIPPPTVPHDFLITLSKKSPAHPLFGRGHPYGYIVDGVEGGKIHLHRGRNYTFYVQASCQHSFFIATGGTPDDSEPYESVSHIFNCINDYPVLILPVDDTTPDFLWYHCDFHPWMGGPIVISDPPEEKASGVSPLAVSFAILFSMVILIQ